MATFNVNDTARRVQYTSSGQSSHTFNFQVNAISETQVHKNDTLLTEATHYNTSLNADGTGTITFTSGNVPTSGDIITIIGDQPLSRTGVYSTGQVITPAALETDFDNVVIRQQQLKEITDRSVQLKPTTPRTVTGTGTSGPIYFPYSTTSANSGKIIRYNAAGTSLELGPESTSLDTLAALSNEISTLSGMTSAISGVHSNATNINAVNSNAANINTVAGNLTSIADFANIYLGAKSSAPTQDPDGSALDDGDLYFDTQTDTLKVYASGSGWQSAGSAINGTSARYKYTVSGTPTTLSGNDDNGAALAYDAGFIDVYLNGVKQVNGTDVTVTSGNSLVFASALAAGDIVEAVAFGTFAVANIAASAISSGTLAVARGGTGLSSLSGNAGKALLVNNSANGFTLANASSAEVYGFNLSVVASTVNYTVTVASYAGGNKFHILGVPQATLELVEGNTYVFTYPAAHPFALSTTSNNSGNSEYTTGVTRNSGANTLTYVVPASAPQLYYYCTNHSGMGGTANTPGAVNNNLQVTTTNQGVDNIDAATYASFDDVLFSASGFTFSLSEGSLIATI